MGQEFKSGFVSMMGRTNVGKSSIMNSLVKEKVAAIANKPQTTRNAIRAIVNRDDVQIIFIDTPGIHKPKSKLGNTMVVNEEGYEQQRPEVSISFKAQQEMRAWAKELAITPSARARINKGAKIDDDSDPEMERMISK